VAVGGIWVVVLASVVLVVWQLVEKVADIPVFRTSFVLLFHPSSSASLVFAVLLILIFLVLLSLFLISFALLDRQTVGVGIVVASYRVAVEDIGRAGIVEAAAGRPVTASVASPVVVEIEVAWNIVVAGVGLAGIVGVAAGVPVAVVVVLQVVAGTEVERDIAGAVSRLVVAEGIGQVDIVVMVADIEVVVVASLVVVGSAVGTVAVAGRSAVVVVEVENSGPDT